MRHVLLLVPLAIACAPAPVDTRAGEGEGDAGEGEGDASEGEGDAGEGEGEGEGEGDGATFHDVIVTNPVLAGDRPDPHVLRTSDESGALYTLAHTIHDGGDLPLFTSRDLITWTPVDHGAFDRARTPGDSIHVGDFHYCSLWAPEITALPVGYMLSFSAQRYANAQTPCPGYAEDGGVYAAWSASPQGSFAPVDRPWEPLPFGGHIAFCPEDTRAQLPRSLTTASQDCQGGFCHQVIRLDGDPWFDDPADGGDGRWWLAYSWYTNTPPAVQWEEDNYGEHLSIVQLDAADPFTVPCTADTPQIFAVNAHDANLEAQLASSCDRCGEMLSFVNARDDQPFFREGHVFGVAEAASLWRHAGFVYLFFSHSVFDSSFYAVSWIAAPTVEGLSLDNAERRVGRLLIPGQQQSFGHGVPVLGPDGASWFYVHHRLRHDACVAFGDCARDVWLAPLAFTTDGDGFQRPVPVFPAETPTVTVRVPN